MSWLPKHRIVVPVDFSDGLLGAIRIAMEHSEKPENVYVLHVIPELHPVSPIGVWGDADVIADLKDKAARHLQTYLASGEINGVRSVVEVGEPGHRIVEFADEQNVDLIVIPSHGYHGVKRALLGSVAERVIRHANCATLVLRRPDAE